MFKTTEKIFYRLTPYKEYLCHMQLINLPNLYGNHISIVPDVVVAKSHDQEENLTESTGSFQQVLFVCMEKVGRSRYYLLIGSIYLEAFWNP